MHQQPRPTPARALRASERAHVLDVLASPRFVDRSPAEVVATLLDEGRYLCAERTMYRILAANQPVRERRNQRSHPCYTKPELVAAGLARETGPFLDPRNRLFEGIDADRFGFRRIERYRKHKLFAARAQTHCLRLLERANEIVRHKALDLMKFDLLVLFGLE